MRTLNSNFMISMAAKRKAESPYFCEACGKGFDYKSKFSRHLESGSHKMYVESLAIMPESESLQGQPLEPTQSLLNSDDTILPATLHDIPDIIVPLTLNTYNFSMHLTLYFVIIVEKVANESSDDGTDDDDSSCESPQGDSDAESASSVFDIGKHNYYLNNRS